VEDTASKTVSMKYTRGILATVMKVNTATFLEETPETLSPDAAAHAIA
jgi:hypothetical protein